MDNLGLIAALGAALAWGSYAVPFKKSRSENFVQFQALMGVGILISGLILSRVLGYSINLNIYGIIGGILWASANLISLTAISNLGLSRAAPVMASIVILCSFLWGVLVFQEIPSGLILGFIGIGLIITGVILVSTTTKVVSQNVKKGLIAAVLAGLIWGSQLTPLKIGKLTTEDFFFSSCFGIFATAMLIALVTKLKFKKEAYKESLLSGIVWNIGNILSIVSISIIGLAKGLPISQLASLVAVGWGIFYFKEITQKKKILQVLLGTATLFIGVIVLGLA